MTGVGSARVMTAMNDSSAMRTMERTRAKYSRKCRRLRKGMRIAIASARAERTAIRYVLRCVEWEVRVQLLEPGSHETRSWRKHD